MVKKPMRIEEILTFKVKEQNKKWSYVKLPDHYVGRECYVEIIDEE